MRRGVPDAVDGLTPFKRRFVAEYLKDLNAAYAYCRAIGEPGVWRANAKGYQILHEPAVQAAIKIGEERQLRAAGYSAARNLRELCQIAFLDHREFFDEQGNVKSPTTWTPAQGAAVVGSETVIKNARAGDGHTDTVLKIRQADKVKANEILAKHFGLLVDRVEVSGAEALVKLLQSARDQIGRAHV